MTRTFRLAALFVLAAFPAALPADDSIPASEWMPADERLKLPFVNDTPIVFVSRNQKAAEWDKLSGFWNETTENCPRPENRLAGGAQGGEDQGAARPERRPPVPAENPMTRRQVEARQAALLRPGPLLGRRRSPAPPATTRSKGFTDQRPVSTGIGGLKLGGMSAPTVINSAYNRAAVLGRPGRLARRSGPGAGRQRRRDVQTARGTPGTEAVSRSAPDAGLRRGNSSAVFGTLPTRDGAAKAIAAYERTVLSGNSHPRPRRPGHAAARRRGGDRQVRADGRGLRGGPQGRRCRGRTRPPSSRSASTPEDAASRRDRPRRWPAAGRCSSARPAATTATSATTSRDGQFHNLGVGAKDGKLPEDGSAASARCRPGHKDPDLVGAFKTPTLRGLLGTAPVHARRQRGDAGKGRRLLRPGRQRQRVPRRQDARHEAETKSVPASEREQTYQGPEVNTVRSSRSRSCRSS